MTRAVWVFPVCAFVLACATSPDSPDPGVLRLYVAAREPQLSEAGNDTFTLRFWNERAYREDGAWADVFDSLEGYFANRNILTDTVEILSAARTSPGRRIGCSHLPPAWYDSLTLSVDHMGYVIVAGTRIPVSSATEERRTVVPYRFRIEERDTLDLLLVCHADSSLVRHGDEFKFRPVISVREVMP